jgi:predicted metal-dependent HD superfamily phosphohydrolase
MTQVFLAERWTQAHADLGVTPDAQTLEEVLANWSSEGRHYHALSHLRHGLAALDRYGPDAALARLVWFFHDVIYEPSRTDNEEKSADWFEAYAHALGLDADILRRGRDLILFTRDHQGARSDDPLWPLLNDADLAIFAAPRPAYDAYAENVWREYASAVPRPAFVAGRTAFLTAFKSRPIFLTEEMKPMAPVAIANIETELERLREEARTSPA